MPCHSGGGNVSPADAPEHRCLFYREAASLNCHREATALNFSSPPRAFAAGAGAGEQPAGSGHGCSRGGGGVGVDFYTALDSFLAGRGGTDSPYTTGTPGDQTKSLMPVNRHLIFSSTASSCL